MTYGFAVGKKCLSMTYGFAVGKNARVRKIRCKAERWIFGKIDVDR